MDAALACTVLDYGDHALMLQCDSTADAMAWTDALRAAALPGVVDIVAASRTVLVKLDAPRYQGVTPSAAAQVAGHPRGGGCGRSPMRPGNRRRLRRPRPRRGRPLHRPDHRSGHQRPHRHRMAGGIQWVRPGVRLPDRRRPEPAGAAPARTAHLDAARIGRPRRRIQRDISISSAQRLADHRPHRRGPVGCRPTPAGAAHTGHVGSVPGRLSWRKQP